MTIIRTQLALLRFDTESKHPGSSILPVGHAHGVFACAGVVVTVVVGSSNKSEVRSSSITVTKVKGNLHGEVVRDFDICASGKRRPKTSNYSSGLVFPVVNIARLRKFTLRSTVLLP